MITTHNKTIYFGISIVLLLLFVADLFIGNVNISISETTAILFGGDSTSINYEIVANYRLPKAIAAVAIGSALALSGLMMQTLFRNPLADPYILGVSSGAGLGVALLLMLGGILPTFITQNNYAITLAATLGASLVMLLVIAVSFKIKEAVSLLIVGIMFGTFASSIVSLIQYFTNPDALKIFVLWNMGSLGAITWQQLHIVLPIVAIASTIGFGLYRNMDALLLGEANAQTMGVSVKQTRILIVLLTGILTGTVTAFAGPIAFVGIAVPHISRSIFRTANHKILIPTSLLMGATLLLICDILAQLPTYTIPINTISAIFGAPIIIWILLKKRQ